jgi:hypothetical protein
MAVTVLAADSAVGLFLVSEQGEDKLKLRILPRAAHNADDTAELIFVRCLSSLQSGHKPVATLVDAIECPRGRRRLSRPAVMVDPGHPTDNIWYAHSMESRNKHA